MAFVAAAPLVADDSPLVCFSGSSLALISLPLSS
jgi:hypothetical protein